MSDADTTAWRRRAERCDDRVKELRAELARRDEQIAAVRALHVPFDAEHRIRGTVQCCGHCSHLIGDYEHWPCATVRVLVDGGTS